MSIIQKPLCACRVLCCLRRWLKPAGLAMLLASMPAYAVNDPSNVKVAQMSNSSMQVTWTDNSNDETGFRIERRSSTTGGGAWSSWSLQHTTAANATNWTQSSSLTSGTTYQYRVRGNGSTNSNFVESNARSFYTFTATNLGVGLTPTMTYSNGIMTIEAAGTGIEGTVDSFYFVSTNLAADGQIVARIDSVSNTDSWTQAGVMVRDQLGTNSSHVMMMLRPTAGSAFVYRTTGGGSTVNSWDNPGDAIRYMKPPKWFKLVRKGNVIKSYSSDDGLCWRRQVYKNEQTTAELTFAFQDAYWGIALSSNVSGTEATTQISNLQVETIIQPINKDCPIAAVDAELPVPSTWIVAPGKFSGPDWDYTTTNPNTSPAPEKCYSWDNDDPNSNPPYVALRRDGPDHPNCLVYEEILPWTSLSYNSSAWPDDPAGFGNTPVNEGDVKNTTWNSNSLWLRKEFTLSSQAQADELVLWGRWSGGITVYINGILATSNSAGRDLYTYLGISSQARAALNTNGTNVIAVRLTAFDWGFDEEDDVVEFGHGHKFFDLGITRNAAMANLYTNAMTAPATDFLASFADTMKEYMQQQGIPGGTMAVLDDGQIVASHVFGYQNGSLTTNMPDHAILRLASIDKSVTRAIIVKLIELGDAGLTPTTAVFPYLNDPNGLNLGIQMIPGYGSHDSDIDAITVDDLVTFKSGLPEFDGEQWHHEKVSFELGITPAQWEADHLARWIYSQQIAPPPLAEGVYSSGGHFLLRYLAQKIIEEHYSGDLNSFMANQMGLVDITVSHERVGPGERDLAKEPGYILVDPLKDRHLGLEKYYALGASAEGMALFFNNYGMDYQLVSGVYQPYGNHNAGGMDGTWAVVKHDAGRALAMMVNMGGNFDTLATMLESLKEQPECSWENFDAPADGAVLYLQNLWELRQYLNVEHGLKSSPIAGDYWGSSQWELDQVGTSPVTHYTLRNIATNEYLYIDTGDGNKLKMGTGTLDAKYKWAFELVSGGSPEYRIRNMQVTNHYINTETQGDEDSNFRDFDVETTTIDNGWWSAQWRLCDSDPDS